MTNTSSRILRDAEQSGGHADRVARKHDGRFFRKPSRIRSQ